MVKGTCASGGSGTPLLWQIAGKVGVSVTVGVMLGVVVIVGVCVMVGVGVLVGVYGGAQPVAPQASQQLVNTPVHTEPPDGALHLLAFGLTPHFVLPLQVVRQHVTAPGRPQVERVAQRLAATTHSDDRPSSAWARLMTCLAQRT